MKIHIAQYLLKDRFRCLTVPQKIRDRRHPRDLLLKRGDHVVRAVRHELDDISSALPDRIVLIHEDAERNDRRDLFAERIIIRDILRDLSRLNIDLSGIRLLQAKILQNKKISLPDSASYIKMSEFIRRQHHRGIRHISLDGSIRPGCHRDASDRSVSLELDGEEILLPLQHNAHHEPRCHRAPERGRTDRTQPVNFPRVFRHTLCCTCKCPDELVRRSCSYYIIHKNPPRSRPLHCILYDAEFP